MSCKNKSWKNFLSLFHPFPLAQLVEMVTCFLLEFHGWRRMEASSFLLVSQLFLSPSIMEVVKTESFKFSLGLSTLSFSLGFGSGQDKHETKIGIWEVLAWHILHGSLGIFTWQFGHLAIILTLGKNLDICQMHVFCVKTLFKYGQIIFSGHAVAPLICSN